MGAVSAEMPVVTPSRASIETVKAVHAAASGCCDINGSAAASARSGVSARQIRPRPCLAMKLIASGVAICAGNDQVALVLAVLVIDQDEHAAIARLLDDFLDRGERLNPATGLV